MRDLEIRGAGNLLGSEQSGYVTSVGFELYCQMIQEAVRGLQGLEEETFTLPPADIPVSAYFPEEYIPTEGLRMAFYKKLAGVRDRAELRDAQAELEDRFGDPPPSVWNMLHLVQLRLDCIDAGVSAIKGDRARVRFNLRRGLSRHEMIAITNRHRGWHAEADHIEVVLPSGADVLESARVLLKEIRREVGPPPSTKASGEVTRRAAEAPKSSKPQKPRVKPLEGVTGRAGDGGRVSASVSAPGPVPGSASGLSKPPKPPKPGGRPAPQGSVPKSAVTRIRLGATNDWTRSVGDTKKRRG